MVVVVVVGIILHRQSLDNITKPHIKIYGYVIFDEIDFTAAHEWVNIALGSRYPNRAEGLSVQTKKRDSLSELIEKRVKR